MTPDRFPSSCGSPTAIDRAFSGDAAARAAAAAMADHDPEHDNERLASADHDQPPAPLEHILLVTGVPRSGTHLIGRLLLPLQYGVPLEYYQSLHRKTLTRRWGLGADENYFEAIARHRTIRGYCAITCFPQGFGELKAELAMRAGVTRISCIHLWRRDSLAQAISFRLALRSGYWDVTSGPTSLPKPVDVHDLDALSEARAGLIGRQLYWRGYLARQGFDTLHVAYEDLVAEREASLRRIIHFLEPGRDATALPLLTEPPTGERLRARQGVPETERQRLYDAYIERFGAPTPLPEP